MHTIHHIASLELPELQPYRTLRRPIEHQRQGILVAEGEKVVRRLLESSLKTVSMLLTPHWFAALELLIAQRKEAIQVYIAEKRLVESIVGYRLHQGVMAVARVPPDPAIDDVLHRSTRPLLLAAVDGLTNSENLGVLVRNCAAFGAHALLVGETSSSPYLRRAVRNSMGAVFTLPVVHAHHLVAVLDDVRRRFGVRIIAAHPPQETHGRQSALTQSAFGGLEHDCCIVFGSEGKGISEAVLTACDQRIGVPMANGVDSLNVASACAVLLYEAQRQRQTLP
jgi:tRNA G18 (ribose-2'-O)-methylase SpoU